MKTTTHYLPGKLTNLGDIINIFRFSKYYLNEVGWILSARKKQSIDKNGSPLPWLTYPAIKFLEGKAEKLNKCNVLEYGSGNSTKWWANKNVNIHSVESDAKYFRAIQEINDERINIILRSKEHGIYENSAIEFNKKFDVVVIDGIRRLECAKCSMPIMSENSVVILDNSKRDELVQVYKLYLNHGYQSIDFYGPTPISPIESCTTIFYKEKNILEI
jgi:hypothetical protein